MPIDLAEAVATVREALPLMETMWDGDESAYAELPFERYENDQAALRLLARWLVERLDAGELVRVKGMEWEGNESYQYANFPIGSGGLESFELKDGGKWQYGIGDGIYRDCDSLEDGKSRCEQWYRSRLAAFLEPLLPEV